MNTKTIFFLTIFFALIRSAAAGVVTSFPILTMITKELIDPQTPLLTLASSGEQAHHFEPGPKGIIELQKQDLLIANGLGFENWIGHIKTKAPKSLTIIEASEGIEPLRNATNEPDPHAWHSPKNLLVYISNIEKALKRRFPHQEAGISERAKKLREQIQNWSQSKQSQWKDIPSTSIIVTTHDGFKYLASAYGLNIVALLGSHDGESVSPRQMTLQLQKIKKHFPRVFLGEGGPQDEILRNWAIKTNSIWGGKLWGDSFPEGEKLPRLLEYMEHNANVLFNALAKKSTPPLPKGAGY